MNKNINVLIVEHDSKWQRILVNALSKDGFTISGCATNLEDAHLLVESIKFDIALVDTHIGDQADGLALGNIIRQKYHKPFIFITGALDPDLFDTAILTNSSCYLTKPFADETLLLNIRNAVNQFNITNELNTANDSNNTNHFFFAKNGNQYKRIEWHEVVCLQSDRNYTKVITNKDELYMIRCSLQNAMKEVIPVNIRPNFLQINRAEVFQIGYIKKIINNTVVIDSKEFEVTDGYIKNLKQKLNIIL